MRWVATFKHKDYLNFPISVMRFSLITELKLSYKWDIFPLALNYSQSSPMSNFLSTFTDKIEQYVIEDITRIIRRCFVK